MLCCTLFFSFPTSVMAKKKHNKQVRSKFLKAIWKKLFDVVSYVISVLINLFQNKYFVC